MGINQSIYYTMPVPVQNALVSAYGYYLRHKRRGSAHQLVRRVIEQSRGWSQAEVETHQARALRRTLDRCEREVPYYRETWSAAGIKAAQVQATADLPLLPVLPKDDVRRRGSDFRVPGAEPYWTNHTSGSTGTPVVVHLDEHTYLLVHALLDAHESACGIHEGDVRATFAGRMVQPADRMSPPFWRYNRALRQLLFSAYHMNEQTLPFYVEELARRQPAELIGYPSAIATVALHMIRAGQAGLVRPKVVVTNSETLFGWQREAIETAFCCPVRDYYGSAEALIFAPQCREGSYHFNPLIGVAEILDEHDRPVPPGGSGRLVCTTLTNPVMPLVRYEIGDAATRLDGPCRCGSPLDGAKEILGRQDDIITTPDGRAIGRVDHIFKGITGIRECQVVQDTVDVVRLLIVADAGFDAAQERLVRENAHSRLGDAVRVQLERVKEIPRTRAGKFRGVVSRVGRQPGVQPAAGSPSGTSSSTSIGA